MCAHSCVICHLCMQSWALYHLCTHCWAVLSEHSTIFAYIDEQSTICVHIVEHWAIYAHIAEHFTICVHIAEHSFMCACIVEHSTIYVHIVHPNHLTNSHIWWHMAQNAWMSMPLPNSYKNFKFQTTPFNKRALQAHNVSSFSILHTYILCSKKYLYFINSYLHLSKTFFVMLLRGFAIQ